MDVVLVSDKKRWAWQERIDEFKTEFGILSHHYIPQPSPPSRSVTQYRPWRFFKYGGIYDKANSFFSFSPSGLSSFYPDEFFKKYDLIVVRYLRTLISLPSSLLRSPQCPKILLDVDDLDTKLFQSTYGPLFPSKHLFSLFFKYLAKRKIQSIQKRYFKYCDHIWVADNHDLSELPRGKRSTLKNIPWVAPAPLKVKSSQPKKETVLFIATLSFAPNYEGLAHFTEYVWPRVITTCPNAKLRVIGRGLPPSLEPQLAAFPAIELLGFVENLESEYASAKLAVAPVYRGGGTKIKVLESLAYNCPVVASLHASEGFENTLVREKAIWVGDTDASMANGIINILRDADLAEKMAAKGRAIVLSEFSFEGFKEEVQKRCIASC